MTFGLGIRADPEAAGGHDQAAGKQTKSARFCWCVQQVVCSTSSGKSTTHWRKLEERIQRGLGSPCPLLLIGLPSSVITLHEGRAALAEVMNDREEDSSAD